MSKCGFCALLIIGLGAFIALYPDIAFAQFSGGELESKVNGVTSGLISFLLPAVSAIGLVYAAILAATGDASAKQRMVLVAVTSLIGMLAPLIIRWIQGMAM